MKVFNGCNLLIPAISPEVNMQIFPVMGHIVSHGFLACSYLPVTIAFPTLVSVLVGQAAIVPDFILLETFSDYLTDMEAKTLQEANATQSKVEGRPHFGACQIQLQGNSLR